MGSKRPSGVPPPVKTEEEEGGGRGAEEEEEEEYDITDGISALSIIAIPPSPLPLMSSRRFLCILSSAIFFWRMRRKQQHKTKKAGKTRRKSDETRTNVRMRY